MAIKLTTTHEAAKLHGVKALVYGRAGVGKTSLCATAPNPIIISAEAGLLSLADHNIPVIQIENFQDVAEAYQFITEDPSAAQFETVCLDSVSEIAEVCLSYEKALAKDPRQAYGELANKMTEVIRAFRDLSGKNVYFTAKGGHNKDDQSGITMYGPSMPGQTLTKNIAFFFDLVMQLEIGTTEDNTDFRYLRTQPTINIEAKDRSGKLDAIEVPDLSVIFNKIIKGEVSTTAPVAEPTNETETS